MKSINQFSEVIVQLSQNSAQTADSLNITPVSIT